MLKIHHYKLFKIIPNLSKQQIKIPILGKLLPKVGQIPVYRSGQSNQEPLRAAKEFLRAGQVVVVFPEGTLTRDPQLWPMRGKSGAIRMAAELNVPIVPAAHWGVDKVLGNYTGKFRPNPFHTVRVKIGDPINLEIGTNPTAQQINDATELVMQKIAALVGELRGETPPAKLWGVLSTSIIYRREEFKKQRNSHSFGN